MVGNHCTHTRNPHSHQIHPPNNSNPWDAKFSHRTRSQISLGGPEDRGTGNSDSVKTDAAVAYLISAECNPFTGVHMYNASWRTLPGLYQMEVSNVRPNTNSCFKYSANKIIQLLLLLLQPLYDPLSRTTQVSRYQKDKPFWILLKQRWWGGSGISWTICKLFALRSRR